MIRPRGFTILSVLFAFSTVGAIGAGLRITASFGFVPGSLCFINGLAALISAIGLWLCRPWAFHALIIYSILALLRIFNMQFGLPNYNIPLQYFIPYAIFVGVLFVLLLYYVRKKYSKLSAENSSESVTGHSVTPKSKKEVSIIKSICYSSLIFLIISFINFAITIFFISRNFFPVAIFNTLLNLIPIYLLSKYFIAPLENRKIYLSFWVSTIILSMLLIIPYGEYVLDIVIDIFRAATQK